MKFSGALEIRSTLSLLKWKGFRRSRYVDGEEYQRASVSLTPTSATLITLWLWESYTLLFLILISHMTPRTSQSIPGSPIISSYNHGSWLRIAKWFFFFLLHRSIILNLMIYINTDTYTQIILHLIIIYIYTCTHI